MQVFELIMTAIYTCTAFASKTAAAPPTSIYGATIRAQPETRGKRGAEHHHLVFQVDCADGAQLLFRCDSERTLVEWCSRLIFYARLPPSQQVNRGQNFPLIAFLLSKNMLLKNQ